jgi:predicted dehydrogenase
VQENALMAGEIPGKPDWGTEPDGERGLLHTEKEGTVIREYIPSLQGNYMDYYDGIYEAIRNSAPVPVTAEDGLNVIRIIDAAFKSNDEKRVLEMKAV